MFCSTSVLVAIFYSGTTNKKWAPGPLLKLLLVRFSKQKAPCRGLLVLPRRRPQELQAGRITQQFATTAELLNIPTESLRYLCSINPQHQIVIKLLNSFY